MNVILIVNPPHPWYRARLEVPARETSLEGIQPRPPGIIDGVTVLKIRRDIETWLVPRVIEVEIITAAAEETEEVIIEAIGTITTTEARLWIGDTTMKP